MAEGTNYPLPSSDEETESVYSFDDKENIPPPDAQEEFEPAEVWESDWSSSAGESAELPELETSGHEADDEDDAETFTLPFQQLEALTLEVSSNRTTPSRAARRPRPPTPGLQLSQHTTSDQTVLPVLPDDLSNEERVQEWLFRDARRLIRRNVRFSPYVTHL